MHGRREAWRPPHAIRPIRPIRPTRHMPGPPHAQRVHRHHWGRVRRVPPPALVLFAIVGVVVGLSVIATVLSFMFVTALVAAPVLLTVGAVRAVSHRSRKRRQALAGAHQRGGPALAAGHAVDPWPHARSRFATLRSEYAAYECDALAVLRMPALADVSVPSTARFVEAFAEAQALDADGPVPTAHRDRYVAAVDTAWRAWQAAREAAERIRLSHLPEHERSTVERVVRLLTTARDTDNDAERHVAYGKARSELARLERTSGIRIPRLAQAKLDNAYRGQLPA